MDLENLSRDIEAIYDATIDNNMWITAQEILTSYSNTIASHLLLFNSDLTVESSSMYSGWGPEVALEASKEYSDIYYQYDSHKALEYSTMNDRKVVSRDQIFSDFERRSCPIHNDFNKKFDCQQQLIVGARQGDKFLHVIATRPEGIGEFEAQEKKLFGLVSSHVMKAMSISDHLQSMFGYEPKLTKIFQDQKNVTLVVDESLNIYWQSDTANHFLLKPGDLQNQKGRLAINSSSLRESLSAEVKKAVNNSEDEREKCSVLKIVQNNNTHAAVIFSSKRNTVFATDKCRVATIVIRLPVELADIHEKKLASVFKLTPSETKLAISIAAGISLQGYAASHHKSINTVRSAAKQIFAKTGMRSQAALTNLVHSL